MEYAANSFELFLAICAREIKRSCAEVLPTGRERLQTFDVVGPMDCMRSVLLHVCALAGWPCEQDMPRLDLALKLSLRHKPKGVSAGGVMMCEASAWGKFELLNASVREAASPFTT